jgi:glutaredoxin 3
MQYGQSGDAVQWASGVAGICRLVRGRWLAHMEVADAMVLYVKSWCPWCVEAREYLDRRGFDYEVRDVLDDPQAYARMREVSRQSLTPTLEIDGRVLPDFDTGQLEEFLATHGIKP